MLQAILFVVSLLLLLGFFWFYKEETTDKDVATIANADLKKLLLAHVSFYQKLNETDRAVFETRTNDFLSRTAIRGVGTEVSDADKVLVAAGAIIPIFAFKDWRYKNVTEVLIYKNTFNTSFSQTEADRNVLGMVGDGVLNNTMILSQEALRKGFQKNDGQNTALHEFAHLLDKADGSVDGVPEYLLEHHQSLPWLKRIREELVHIRNNDAEDADISRYAGTNEAEFFAEITAYFFEKPEQLKLHHPQLYQDLEQMFSA